MSNVAAEPKLLDMIYTGNETMGTENTVQYLQSYQSFGFVRYFEHFKPGKMGATGSITTQHRLIALRSGLRTHC